MALYDDPVWLREENDRLAGRNNYLTVQVDELTGVNLRLEADNARLTRSEQRAASDLRDADKAFQLQLDRLTATIEASGRSNRNLQNTITTLRNELKATARELERTRAGGDILRDTIRELRADIAAKDKTIRGYREATARMQAEIDQQQADKENQAQTIRDLKTRLSKGALEEELQVARRSLGIARDLADRRAGTINTLEGKVEGLTTTNQSLMERNAYLVKRLRQEQGVEAETTAETEFDLRAELREAKVSVSDLRTQLRLRYRELDRRDVGSTAHAKADAQEISDLRKKIADLERELLAERAELAETTRSLSRGQDNLAGKWREAREKITALETRLDAAINARIDAQNDLDRLRSALGRLADGKAS